MTNIQFHVIILMISLVKQISVYEENFNNFLNITRYYERLYDMVEDKGSKEEKRLQDALEFSDAIIATVREPLLVLDKELRIITANRSFYRTFRVNPEDT